MDSISKQKKILFVFEGERAEKQIVQSLIKNNFFDRESYLVAFCGDVYQMYQKIKPFLFEETDESYDFFVDLKNLNNNLELNGVKRREIEAIYLFFDYDGHSNYSNDENLKELLDFFDEETERGKLFISYPMVEALKHIVDFKDFKSTAVEGKKNIGYKNLISEHCKKEYIQINKYNEDIWKELIKAHLYKMNYIVADEYIYPSQIYSQLEIFEKQKGKFINKENKVSVLSAFPIFIHDYYGNETTKIKFNL